MIFLILHEFRTRTHSHKSLEFITRYYTRIPMTRMTDSNGGMAGCREIYLPRLDVCTEGWGMSSGEPLGWFKYEHFTFALV